MCALCAQCALCALRARVQIVQQTRHAYLISASMGNISASVEFVAETQSALTENNIDIVDHATAHLFVSMFGGRSLVKNVRGIYLSA